MLNVYLNNENFNLKQIKDKETKLLYIFIYQIMNVSTYYSLHQFLLDLKILDVAYILYT